MQIINCQLQCKIQLSTSDIQLPCERCTCSLCSEIQGRTASLHNILIPLATESRILWETEQWVVIPTLGPLSLGHIMLVPRNHYYSTLSCTSAMLQECSELLNRCGSVLRSIYRQGVIVFEHGATATESRKCGACIEHAHLHVVPGPSSFVAAARSKFRDWQSGSSILELPDLVENSPYMLVGSCTRRPRFWVRRCSDTVPSQLLRRVLARELGNPTEWDWRKHVGSNVFIKTITDWKNYVGLS